MDQKQHCGNKKYPPKQRPLLRLGWLPAVSATRIIWSGLWTALFLQLHPLAELLVFLNTCAVIPAQKSSVVAQGQWNEVQVFLHLAFKVILVLFPSIHQSPNLTRRSSRWLLPGARPALAFFLVVPSPREDLACLPSLWTLCHPHWLLAQLRCFLLRTISSPVPPCVHGHGAWVCLSVPAFSQGSASPISVSPAPSSMPGIGPEPGEHVPCGKG